MMRALITVALVGGVLLSTGVSAAPGRGGDKDAVIGAAARAKHGPDPMAKPPEDVGSAEDPAPSAPQGQAPANATDAHKPAPPPGSPR